MRDWPSLTIRFPAAGDASLPDLVSASLDPEAVAAIEERSGAEWLVSFRDAAARDAAAADVRTTWSAHGVGVESIEVSDDDWARRSQASLGAIRVGRIVVAPPWLAAPEGEDPGLIRVVIEPSMGFGSGHHATTRLCLHALQSLALAGARVLDIGTGSGILAIAAALLGAGEVLGVDNDPDALESARADAVLNGVQRGLAFSERDFRSGALAPADIVLANLTGGMLAANADAIISSVAPGGRLIISGITTAEAQMVIEAFAPGAMIQWRGDEDGWVGLLLARTG